jgi:hypothetical protein
LLLYDLMPQTVTGTDVFILVAFYEAMSKC